MRKIVLLLDARPHSESLRRRQWGLHIAPRSRPPAAHANGQGRVVRGSGEKLSLPSTRYDIRTIQRRSAAAGGTPGNLAAPRQARARIDAMLKCGCLAPSRNSSYGSMRGRGNRYRRGASQGRVPWPLAGSDNAVVGSVTGHIVRILIGEAMSIPAFGSLGIAGSLIPTCSSAMLLRRDVAQVLNEHGARLHKHSILGGRWIHGLAISFVATASDFPMACCGHLVGHRREVERVARADRGASAAAVLVRHGDVRRGPRERGARSTRVGMVNGRLVSSTYLFTNACRLVQVAAMSKRIVVAWAARRGPGVKVRIGISIEHGHHGTVLVSDVVAASGTLTDWRAEAAAARGAWRVAAAANPSLRLLLPGGSGG